METALSTNYHGLPTRILENEHLRIEYLAEAGPRMVRLHLAGSDTNLFVEVPERKRATPYGEYRIRGGHRLWHAPEAFPRTYLPDNDGLTVTDLSHGVSLQGPVEIAGGIQKTIEIELHSDRPAITVRHTLQNYNLWPVELAPWALSQMPLSGLAIFPQTVGDLDPSGLLPNRQLVLWPYTTWGDARLHLGDDLIFIQAESHLPPLKIGYLNRHGWIAYLHAGILFVKRFSPQPERPHVDFGCNIESFCNDLFIEMEIIAPLSQLQPGAAVTHTELWEFYPGMPVLASPAVGRQVLQEIGML